MRYFDEPESEVPATDDKAASEKPGTGERRNRVLLG